MNKLSEIQNILDDHYRMKLKDVVSIEARETWLYSAIQRVLDKHDDSLPNLCENKNCRKFGLWHPNEPCVL